MRWRRLVPLLAGALGILSCSEKAPTTKTLLMIFDVSDSTTAAERDQYLAWAKDVLTPKSGARLGPGGALVALHITDHPMSDPKVFRLELTPFDPSRENLLVATGRATRQLEGAAQKLEAYVNEPREPVRLSKIRDAILTASSLLKALRRDRNILIVFSDMIEESEGLNFARGTLSVSRAREMVDADRRSGRLPDLTGTRVWVSGAGAGSYARTLSSAQLLGIRAFWLEYFKAAGAELPAERYLPTFAGFTD